MPEIKYSDNPNEETAFVETDDGQRNRAVLTVAVDGEIEFPANPNSTKVSVTVDGVKRKAIAVATIAGGGDQHNLGYYATQTALEEAYPTAEAGDWAIVGATDTVWIWDTDNSEWVDSDQKGQVTSVNGQTGAVSLTIPDAVQYSTMPTAGADNLGDIVQFTGTTDANYTNGYFYKCVSDGQDPATYSWTAVQVQASSGGLPDQTGQSGKFLTTDGTNASWSDKPLVNKDTTSQQNCIAIALGNTVPTGTNANGSVVVGGRAVSNGPQSVVIGESARSNNNTGIAIGAFAKVNNFGGIAIGGNAISSATGAIQIVASWNYSYTNSDTNTFKVGNANGNFEIMSADGTIPTARLTKVNTTATLAVADWLSNTQTVTVSGITSTSVVFVAPDPSDAADYAAAGILCTSQGTNSLTFTATTTPTNDIDVNIVCL